MASNIYLDNVSTTKVDDEVLATYTKLLNDYYNSDALYDGGVTVFRHQEHSRKLIADMLGVKSNEIIFTSGASEANNFVIKGLSLMHPKGHIITSYYEHSSVIEALKQVERTLGIDVTYIKPQSDGTIDPMDVKRALRDDTFLVTIMKVNNEIGTINDLKAIRDALGGHKALFHSDMTQALGKIKIDLSDVDMASFSAHKIHGVKGSGFMYKKAHIKIEPLISAGQQEFHLRGGTSNSPANIVLAKTLRLALEKVDDKRIDEYHDYLINGLKAIKGVVINSNDKGIKSLINISTPIKTEPMINALNLKGIMVSGKSTCGSKENEPSRTLEAMHIDSDHALRISFDLNNTKEDLAYFLECLKEIIEKYE